AKEIRSCHRDEQRNCLELQRAAQSADIRARQCNHQAAQHCRENAKLPWTGPEEVRLQSGEHRDDRRKVDVSESYVTTGVDVIKLISMEIEGAICGKVERNDSGDRTPEDKCGHSRAALDGKRSKARVNALQ